MEKALFDVLMSPAVKQVFDVLAGYQTRIVGGAVRDASLGVLAEDVDFATTATPDEMIKCAEKAGAQAVPTGYEHGTVTLVVEGKGYEVTTLRKDVKTDGRHAEVTYTDNFQADARRRDFTINALYLDKKGGITDYFTGLPDVKAGKVRFIGDAEQRIDEDYLRILRYFRFFAHYSAQPHEEDVLGVIASKAPKLKTLSAERVTKEVLRLLDALKVHDVWRAMRDVGVLEVLDLHKSNEGILLNFERLFPEQVNPLVKLCALFHEHPLHILDVKTLKLSNSQQAKIHEVSAAMGHLAFNHELSLGELRGVLYRFGKWSTIAAAQILAARSNDYEEDYLAISRDAVVYPTPTFPLKGRDVLAHGVAPGEQVGQTLKKVEQWWLENGCPDEDACRNALAKIIKT